MKKILTIENINTSSMLGVALKRLRKQAGISQNELAQSIGIRQATISDLENGRGTLESFFKVIQALKINVVFSNKSFLQTTENSSKIKTVIDLLND